jgi:hypothetical protein
MPSLLPQPDTSESPMNSMRYPGVDAVSTLPLLLTPTEWIVAYDGSVADFA